MTCIILDAILTKKYKNPNDTYIVKALAVVTVLLKNHGLMEAKSFMDFKRVLEKKAKTEIFEYEFFKLYKDLLQSNENFKEEFEAAPEG